MTSKTLNKMARCLLQSDGQIPSYTYPRPKTKNKKLNVSFLMCSVLVKFPPLYGKHRAGTGSRGFRVPARWHKLLETAQTAGLNPDCYMSENTTKYIGHQPVVRLERLICIWSVTYYFSKQPILNLWTNCIYMAFTCQNILCSTALNCQPNSFTGRRIREYALIMADIPIDRFEHLVTLVSNLLLQRVGGCFGISFSYTSFPLLSF